MGAGRRLAERVLDAAIGATRLNVPGRIKMRVLERIQPVYEVSRNGKVYRFSCPNALVHWRAQTLFTKEPDTLEWIDNFDKGDVLFDVGANIGLYSIYAGMRGHPVLAFEPEAQNFAQLSTNVHLNGLDHLISCYAIALSDQYARDVLYLSGFEVGGALVNIGLPTDWRHEEFSPVASQGVISYPMDRFLRDFPDVFPNHIKIDVDGSEDRIIDGATQTLRDARLKSLLIELNLQLEPHREVCELLNSSGFELTSSAPSPLASEQFRSVHNHVFRRTASMTMGPSQ